jgi:hypothetical protein
MNLTLDKIVTAMRKRRIADSSSAVWRFFARRKFSFKKFCTRLSRSVQAHPAHPELDARGCPLARSRRS